MDHLDFSLAPWLRRACRVIEDRFQDARSHARTGYISVAAQRLVDLHHALAGPDGGGVIGDARAAFYRDAHAEFDPELHDPDRRFPTAEGVAAARTAPIGGIDLRRDLGLRIEQARQHLATALGGPAALNAIDTWHEQHSTALKSWARRTLSDSQITLHAAINWLRLKDEYRDGE